MTNPQNASIDEIFHLFETSKKGLSPSQVLEHRKKFGENRLPEVARRSSLECFFRQFASPIVLILAAAGAIKALLQQYKDSIAILGVLLFNSMLGFFQERKAEKSMNALRKLTVPTAKAIRNGEIVIIPSSEIVIGDIILLESGTKIAADARLIETHNLFVDESILSGEAIAREKNPSGDRSSMTMLDSPNMVFAGTIVSKGRGKACVVAVGKETQTSQIIEATNAATPPAAPLQKKIGAFAHRISLVSSLIALLLILIGSLQGHNIYDLTMTGISLMISAIPEGLPIAITVVLSYGLLKMAERKAIVRNLATVETLGSTSVICVDKTGTLTQNHMTVAEVFVDQGISEVWAKRVALYCTETTLGEHKHIGDQLEEALMRYAIHQGQGDEGFQIELTQPYESEHQKMAVRISKNQESHILWKGSYESLKPFCSTMWKNGALVAFDDNHFSKKLDEMTKRGFRVISLSVDQTMIGLIGLEDPPRKDVAGVIKRCLDAKIRVIIITGDHPNTALSVARNVGIPIDPDVPYLSGKSITEASDETLRTQVERTTIFARVSPQDKLRIVKMLQANGEIVAMTGDGINDAPSIAQANIGISMGSGTDVAKEASSMVLLDNSFSCIFEAIRQGRIIFKSLQQTLCYLLTTSIGGVLTIIASLLAQLPIPLLPLQILFINMITDGTTTIPLALEGEHGDVMKHAPRKQNMPLLSYTIYLRAIMSACIMMIGTITIFWHYLPSSLEHAQTIAFSTLAFYQILNAYNARSEHRSLFFTYKKKDTTLSPIPFFQNRILLIITGLAIALQIAAIENSYFREFLHTTDLNLSEWLSISLTASTILLYAELDKAWRFFSTVRP